MGAASYLFAVEAERLLDEGRPEEAVSLCLEGIEDYPDYFSAWSVLSRAYLAMGDEQSAAIAAEKASNKYPAAKVFELTFHKETVTSEESLFEPEEPEAIEPADEEFEASLRDLESSVLTDNSETGDDLIADFYLEDTETQPLMSELSPETEEIEDFELNSEFELTEYGITDEEIAEEVRPAELQLDDASSEADICPPGENYISEVSIDEDIELIGLTDFGRKEITAISPEVELKFDMTNEHDDETIDESRESLESVSCKHVRVNRFLRNARKLKGGDAGVITAGNPDLIPGFESIMFDSLVGKGKQPIAPDFFGMFFPYEMPDDIKGVGLAASSIPMDAGSLLHDIEVDGFEAREPDIFESLASRLENAKISAPENFMDEGFIEIENESGEAIVSETMARIYASQGAVQEAMDAYRLLAEREPDKKEYYLSLIDELENSESTSCD